MTYEELKQEYDTLAQEEKRIPAKLNVIIQEATDIENQITSLKKQAGELDLAISELPVQTYEKQCGAAFLGLGKTCQEVPVPNPAISNVVVQRNNLIRQSNSLQLSLEDKYRQISDLTQEQIEIQKRQIQIRGEITAEQKKLITGPFDFLGFLFGRQPTLMAQELLQSERGPEAEAGVLTIVKKYLPLAAVAGGVMLVIFFIKRRRRAE